MKVLLVTDTYFPAIGGISQTIRNLFQYLQKTGATCKLIAPGPSLPDDGENIYRLPYFKDPFIKGKTGALFPMHLFIIRNIVRQENPDLIHIEEAGGVGASTLFWAKYYRKKVIGTLHSDPRQVVVINSFLRLIPFFEPLLKKYLEFFYNQCDLITVPTESFKKKMKFKKPVVPISNGVDLEKFKPLAMKDEAFLNKYKLPRDKKIFLYFGRLDPDKNIACIIDAFAKIKREDIILVLAGSGAMAMPLKKRMRNKSNIFVVPDPKFIEIPSFYQNSDVFVIASRIETQSMVTIEAIACGLPVLVAAAGALPELCRDGINGYLFNPDSPDDLKEKVEQITQDEVQLQDMKRESRNLAEEHGLEKCMSKYVETYKKVINI